MHARPTRASVARRLDVDVCDEAKGLRVVQRLVYSRLELLLTNPVPTGLEQPLVPVWSGGTPGGGHAGS